MRKTLGPVLVIDTDPPYRRWDGNQATYLFFPVFASFLLILLSTLSDPIIPGLSIVNVNTHGNGTVKFGNWGWCASGVPNVTDQCSSHRAFGGSMQPEINQLPEALETLANISESINGPYLIAMGIMRLFACLSTWSSLTWTLAASGAWNDKKEEAWNWTRWSFAGTLCSSLFVVIAWGLELGMLTRVQSKAISVDGSQPSVIPGPAIFMMMSALICCLTSFIVKITWGKFKPRPEWTMKGAQGDFHDPSRPTLNSAALPPSDESPPTWESLNISDTRDVIIDEKQSYPIQPHQPGFAV